MTGDGQTKMMMMINRQHPGPSIVVYEGQEVKIRHIFTHPTGQYHDVSILHFSLRVIYEITLIMSEPVRQDRFCVISMFYCIIFYGQSDFLPLTSQNGATGVKVQTAIWCELLHVLTNITTAAGGYNRECILFC